MSNDRIKDVLRDLDMRVTLARVLILGSFAESCDPMCADDIFKLLKGKNINVVTIYRTLTSFEKSGIIRKVDLRRESVYYEIAGHHHHHIVCTVCGMIEKLDMCDVEEVSKKAVKKSSYFKKVDQHSLEFFGVCTLCLEKKSL